MKERLETLIDENSLTEVLYAIAEICCMKAAHLEENWQDVKAAKEWDRAGSRVSKLTDALAATTHL